MKESFRDFSESIMSGLQSIPIDEIRNVCGIMQATYERDGRIYIIGNGTSFALAGVLASDLNKAAFNASSHSVTRGLCAYRIPSSDSELTAWANDCGYATIFEHCLMNALRDGDLLIALSSSGNSENILRAVHSARERAISIIGFCGYDGGKLGAVCDASICIPANDGESECIESILAAVLKFIARYFKDYLRKDALAPAR